MKLEFYDGFSWYSVATENYVDNKVFNINSNTTGSLSISRLSGYPASSNAFLRGDGVWILPYINNLNISDDVSFANNRIINLANPINGQDAVTKNYADTFTLSPSRISGYPANSSYFLRGDGAWATPSGVGSLSSNSINVNTDGGNTNWLRRNINTTTGTQVYGLTSTSYILENSLGESAGIGFDGSTDTCTIWTAGDGGTILNIQDEDSPNTRIAYVASETGAWTVVSSEKRKHSIRNKANNNVLERFMNLSVKTYGYKYKTEEDSTEKKKTRVEKKSNKMATGLILEEVFKIFPNCLPGYYNKLFQDKKDKSLVFEKEISSPENSGIDYNVLTCYFIMAFQELAKKVEFLEQKLEKD